MTSGELTASNYEIVTQQLAVMRVKSSLMEDRAPPQLKGLKKVKLHLFRIKIKVKKK